MRIREIRAAGLRGATPEGGWDEEIRPDDCVHTLIAVITDEGPVGLGSVFTSDHLVKAALAVLEPLYRGENALEPERVSEKKKGISPICVEGRTRLTPKSRRNWTYPLFSPSFSLLVSP